MFNFSADENDDTMISDKDEMMDSSTVGESLNASISNGVSSSDASGIARSVGKASSAKAMMSSDDDEDNVPWAERIQASAGDARNAKNNSSASSTAKRKAPHVTSSSKKKKMRKSDDEEDWDEEPTRKKSKSSSKKELTKKVKRELSYSEEDEKSAKLKKKSSSSIPVVKKIKKEEIDSPPSTDKKRKKKVVEEEEVWRWWEEEKKEGGIKWNSLEHKGPLFAPPYEPLPKSVKFIYDGKEMKLSESAEEVATFYAKMLDHEYTSKTVFNQNFFKDWRKMMTASERETITDLTKCNFKHMHAYFLAETEKRKAMTKEEKQKIKAEKEGEMKEYGFAMIDGHKQKIGNFRIEPPGLFRGRGDHPKMGRLKKRIQPEDVIINCSKDSVIPKPPSGHKWKEVRHDHMVSWLCGWTENVLGNNKYIMLNPSSKIKGEKDWEKFETARKLKSLIDDIRKQYTIDFKSREMRVRQRAVALYFIDKLALRAGNEKDTEEAADTVGCCSLRCEHVKLFEELDDQKYVVEFDFLGKDSIRYVNKVPVDKTVFKNVKLFMENKEPGDDLFDRLDTSSLNAHLRTLMPGLSAKVFRTYNASITLQDQLEKLTKGYFHLKKNTLKLKSWNGENDNIHNKMLSYNRANRLVAILCNHQRAVPKTHEKSMENLENKISEKKKEVKQLKSDLEKTKAKVEREKLQKRLDQKKEQLKKLKIQRTDKDENKQIALGTSKLNYLDPRISVAWCKKFDVPVEKIFNKTQREKFRWAIDMATDDYIF